MKIAFDLQFPGSAYDMQVAFGTSKFYVIQVSCNTYDMLWI